MDPLLPNLQIVDTTVPQNRQQCLFKASKEAKSLASHNTRYEKSTVLDKRTACEEAKKRCQAVTSTPSEVQYPDQLFITFGKFNGQSFQWLVENDVGYIYLLDLHIKESHHANKKESKVDWVKDLLVRYVHLLPQVSCHLEINVDRAIYWQGRFRSLTFLEMWQWYSLHKAIQADPQAEMDHERKMAQEAYCSVRQWLVMKEDITTKSLKCYILDKEVGLKCP
ncbi:uncharacterized protein [Chanodichthys erythropterus]|uniref:uncharacterized protein n=1 Tax=Chanodichthys erythropterus TaxID=933992 RepID=UPI00351E3F80